MGHAPGRHLRGHGHGRVYLRPGQPCSDPDCSLLLLRGAIHARGDGIEVSRGVTPPHFAMEVQVRCPACGGFINGHTDACGCGTFWCVGRHVEAVLDPARQHPPRHRPPGPHYYEYSPCARHAAEPLRATQ